ncbi:MAG: hypothetical protein IH956_05170, partial [Chloroflexi bacterium]|nr:hypothetical protein [Chloroflexota bacterium]
GGFLINTAISTMMLTIAGIAAAAAVLNAVLPALSRSSGAVVTASAKVDERLNSDIEIVHAIAELDSSGSFSDTNGNGKFDIILWVKNVGSTRVLSVAQGDVFLGQAASFNRIPHETEVQEGQFPRWSYCVEGCSESTEWGPKNTLRITVTYDTTQSQGNYDAKVVIANGVSDTFFFSI